MNEDDTLLTLILVLLHYLAKLIQLVVQYLAVTHATRIIQQFVAFTFRQARHIPPASTTEKDRFS